MKLDKFINRPVLSTVISILLVILGVGYLVHFYLHQRVSSVSNGIPKPMSGNLFGHALTSAPSV